MTGEIFTEKMKMILDSPVKVTKSQKVKASSSQASSSTQKSTGGKKKGSKAPQPQASSSAAQKSSNPFDRLQDSLNGNQRDMLKILFDDVFARNKNIHVEELLKVLTWLKTERKDVLAPYKWSRNSLVIARRYVGCSH